MPPHDDMLPEVDLSDLMTAKQESLEDDVLGNNNQKVSADKESDVFAQVAGIMDSLDLSSDSVAPKATLEEFVIEPRTGFKFPSLLIPNWSEEGSNHIPSAQVCAGVGIRGVSVIRFSVLKIYAFAFYLNAEKMKAELDSKYGSMSLLNFKSKKNFEDDLLSHELEMSVRLIVHHKRVRIGMVKNAFESSLKNRLRKLKGTEDDEGLQVFCSYFTEELSLPAGTVIDFQWQPGGLFHTTVGERFMGTISSVDFCRAFFDLYLGDPAVCPKAKQDIFLNLWQMLQK